MATNVEAELQLFQSKIVTFSGLLDSLDVKIGELCERASAAAFRSPQHAQLLRQIDAQEEQYRTIIQELEHCEGRVTELEVLTGRASRPAAISEPAAGANNSGEAAKAKKGCFEGCVVVFGELGGWSERERLAGKITELGGTVSFSISNNTTFFITSDADWAEKSDRCLEATRFETMTLRPGFIEASAKYNNFSSLKPFLIFAGKDRRPAGSGDVRKQRGGADKSIGTLVVAPAAAAAAAPQQTDEAVLKENTSSEHGAQAGSTFPSDYEIARSFVVQQIAGRRTIFRAVELHVGIEWGTVERERKRGRKAEAAVEYRHGVYVEDLDDDDDEDSRQPITDIIQTRRFRVFMHSGQLGMPEADNKEEWLVESVALAERIFQALFNVAGKQGFSRVGVLSQLVGSERAVRAGGLIPVQSSSGDNSNSLLPSEVQSLVQDLWSEALSSIGALTGATSINGLGITTPLGVLSASQIERAQLVLLKLAKLLSKAGASSEDCQRLSDEYYGIVPNVDPSSITRMQTVSQHAQACQLMLDMLAASETLSGKAIGLNDTDVKYRSLTAKLSVVAPGSADYTSVVEQLKSVGGEGALRNLVIYRVCRAPDEAVFRRGLPNQRRLFHASPIHNWLGILSRGLLVPRIATDLARRDAGKLGAGIYFTDDAVAAVDYTSSKSRSPRRVLAIYNVALGRVHNAADVCTQLSAAPAGFHSVYAGPDTNKSSFAHREYCVYDARQQYPEFLVSFQLDSSSSASFFSTPIPRLDSLSVASKPSAASLTTSSSSASASQKGKGEEQAGLLTDGGQPLPLDKVQVRGKIVDMLAEVVVLQQYSNPHNVAVEAKYVFPLDEMAGVCGFEAFINGKHIVGVVKEKEQAHREYKEAVAAGHGAYLLDQDEERPDVFTVSVGNLPPKSSVLIKITYVTELAVSGQDIEFVMPCTVAPKALANSRAVRTQSSTESIEAAMLNANLGIQLAVQMPYDIVKLECPSHQVSVKRTDTWATVLFAGVGALDDDFVLRIGLATAHEPRMWVEVDERKNAMSALLAYSPQFKFTPCLNAECVLFLDCSASMDGATFSDLKRAARLLIDALPGTCVFNIVVFGSSWDWLLPVAQPLDTCRRQAVAFLDEQSPSLGGSDLWTPLRAHLLLHGEQKPLRNVIVFSDGQLYNSQLVTELVAASVEHARVFFFGVGKSVDRHAVRAIARYGGGCSEILPPSKNPQLRITRQLANFTQPSLTDLHVHWDIDRGEVVQAPTNIVALYAGQRQLVYGALGSGYCLKATLAGRLGEQPISTWVSTSDLAFTQGKLISTLAARAIIRDWEEGIYSPNKLAHEYAKDTRKAEIIRLGIEYSLATQFTSFLAIEVRDNTIDDDAAATGQPSLTELIAQHSVDMLKSISWTQQYPSRPSLSSTSSSTSHVTPIFAAAASSAAGAAASSSAAAPSGSLSVRSGKKKMKQRRSRPIFSSSSGAPQCDLAAESFAAKEVEDVAAPAFEQLYFDDDDFAPSADGWSSPAFAAPPPPPPNEPEDRPFTLADYNIQKESTLHLVLKPLAAPAPRPTPTPAPAPAPSAPVSSFARSSLIAARRTASTVREVAVAFAKKAAAAQSWADVKEEEEEAEEDDYGSSFGGLFGGDEEKADCSPNRAGLVRELKVNNRPTLVQALMRAPVQAAKKSEVQRAEMQEQKVFLSARKPSRTFEKSSEGAFGTPPPPSSTKSSDPRDDPFVAILPLHITTIFQLAHVRRSDIRNGAVLGQIMALLDDCIVNGVTFPGPFGPTQLHPTDLACLSPAEREAICLRVAAKLRELRPSDTKEDTVTHVPVMPPSTFCSASSVVELESSFGYWELSPRLCSVLGLEIEAVLSELCALFGTLQPSTDVLRVFATAIAVAGLTALNPFPADRPRPIVLAIAKGLAYLREREAADARLSHPLQGPNEWLPAGLAFLSFSSCNSVFQHVTPFEALSSADEPVEQPSPAEQKQRLTFVTGNAGKVREVGALLSQVGLTSWDVVQLNVDLPELQGDPEEVAMEKCRRAAAQVSGPVLIEDTSLCFNALGGLPGVYVKWFLEQLPERLHTLLDNFDDNTAFAECIFAYSDGTPGSQPLLFVGRVFGRIVAPRCSATALPFGWDPHFECRDPELENTSDFGKTFAEMDSAVKNSVSHRNRALSSLMQYLSINKSSGAALQDHASQLVALVKASTYSANTLRFITNDHDSVRDLRSALLRAGSTRWDIAPINLPLFAIQGPDALAVLREKCTTAADTLDCPIVLEESYLVCQQLGSLPGPYTSHFSAKLDSKSLERMIAGTGATTATALTVFAFSQGRGFEPQLIATTLEGRVVPPRGFRSFGWDSIFEVTDARLAGTPEYGRTLAEWSSRALAQSSTRAQALEQFCNFLVNL